MGAANLASFIQEVPRSKTLTKEHRKTLFAQRTDASVLARYRSDQSADATAKLYKLGYDLALQGYTVPALGSPIDGLPMTTTAHVRELADRIGFMVIPTEYLSDAYKAPYEESKCIARLENFGLWLFVMAPVPAYSLQKHLKSEDYPVHVPEDVSQAFMALSMSIPVFRAMQHQLDELRDHMRDYRDRVQNLTNEVQALTQRLDTMAEHAARERSRRHSETTEIKHRQEAILTWYRGVSDPLVLALPNGKTIRDDTPAFIGPCWGELPKEIAKVLALTQRKPTPALKAKVK